MFRGGTKSKKQTETKQKKQTMGNSEFSPEHIMSETKGAAVNYR